MRTITTTTNVYTFDELSEQAKENARNWHRSCMDEQDWSADEWVASLEAFAEHFDLRLQSYELGDGRGAHIRLNLEYVDDAIREMSFVRLWKYLDNYGGTVTIIDGGMCGSKDNPLRTHREQRNGHDYILLQKEGACSLTGYYTDCAAFNELAKFVQRPDHRTFEELLRDCMEHVLQCVRDDIEYTYADDTIDENIRANGYEFDEQGSIV